MKVALITGITGQDGAYLADFLLKKGYVVHGLKRRSSLFNTGRIDHLFNNDREQDSRFHYSYADLTDSSNIIRLINEIKPDEIYNLAAMSHVKVSFDTPEYTANADGLGTLRILEAVRILGLEQKIKIYQASTSELFGKIQETPQTENTPFYPRSPYGVAKLYAYWITVNYREAYNMHASNGILFNHESPLRGKEFVTRKITDAAAKIHLNKQDVLELGNLNAKRDWGYAKEYVEGMYRILQAPEADTYVLATNQTQTVRDFVTLSFKTVNIDIEWKGNNENEIGINTKTGKTLIKVNPQFYRPAEVDLLIGDASKAEKNLKWKAKTTLKELADMMVKSDIKRNKNGGSF